MEERAAECEEKVEGWNQAAVKVGAKEFQEVGKAEG